MQVEAPGRAVFHLLAVFDGPARIAGHEDRRAPHPAVPEQMAVLHLVHAHLEIGDVQVRAVGMGADPDGIRATAGDDGIKAVIVVPLIIAQNEKVIAGTAHKAVPAIARVQFKRPGVAGIEGVIAPVGIAAAGKADGAVLGRPHTPGVDEVAAVAAVELVDAGGGHHGFLPGNGHGPGEIAKIVEGHADRLVRVLKAQAVLPGAAVHMDHGIPAHLPQGKAVIAAATVQVGGATGLHRAQAEMVVTFAAGKDDAAPGREGIVSGIEDVGAVAGAVQCLEAGDGGGRHGGRGRALPVLRVLQIAELAHLARAVQFPVQPFAGGDPERVPAVPALK